MRKILVLTAGWCGPCKMLKPIIEEVSVDYPEVEVQQCDIDTDEGMELCAKHRVRGVPTVIAMDGDEVQLTRTGTMTKAEVVKLFTENKTKNQGEKH